MAERRMFAKTITESDAFTEMSVDAQLVYFHLGMIADDDGVVNAPRKIAREIGASADALKELIANRFIIQFDSGVVVIKHWRINNYIQKDRYKPSKYAEELDRLYVKDNGTYSVK